MENVINMVWESFVEGGSSKKDKEGKKRGRGKGREKEGEKESGIPTVGTRQTKK